MFNKWQLYEQRKAELIKRKLSPAELEQALRELAKELRL